MRVFKSVCLCLLLAGCHNFDIGAMQQAFAERDVREKIGILAHTDITWAKSTGALKRALAHFRAEKVDSVVFIGDPTKDGYANQREVFQAAWRESFRGTTPPKQVLAEDPYALHGVAFTARNRYPLTDFLCVYPYDDKTITVGSMHGFERSEIFDRFPSELENRVRGAAQGLLVLVRDSGLTVRRLDFSGKDVLEVGPPWTVDSAGLIHSDDAKAPEFWADTRVRVFRGYDRAGNPTYTVTWPSVLARYTGVRAFSYDVQVGREVIRRVQSSGFCLPEEYDQALVECRIAEAELKGAAPRFGITPLSSSGLRGKTVWSESAAPGGSEP